MTLEQRFRFFRQRHAAPLAYYFARVRHADRAYALPEFLVFLWIGGVK